MRFIWSSTSQELRIPMTLLWSSTHRPYPYPSRSLYWHRIIYITVQCKGTWLTHCGLGSSDAIWWHRSGSILAQVMACCLMAPSHYLNQYFTNHQWGLAPFTWGQFCRCSRYLFLSLKITRLISQPHLPGVSELIPPCDLLNRSPCTRPTNNISTKFEIPPKFGVL